MTEPAGYRWWERRWFALALIALSMVPLLLPPVPPLVDVPGHIGRFHLMLGGSPFLDNFFSPGAIPIGNLGVDLIALPLGRLIGVELATRLIVTFIPALSVAAMLWVAHEVHGRLPPTAAFALPFAYAQPFLYGFLNYCFGLALALAAFAWWLRLGRGGQLGRRALMMAPVGLVVFVAHVSAWGTLGLMVFGAETMREREAGQGWLAAAWRGGLRCTVLLLPLLLLLLWRQDAGGMTQEWFALQRKAFHLASIFRDRWMLVDLAFLFGIAALLITARDDKRLRWLPALVGGGLLLFLAFLVIPGWLLGSSYADMRLAPTILLLLVLAIGLGPTAGTRFAQRVAIVAVLFAIARMAVMTVSLDLAADRHRELLAALDRLPPRSRLAVLVDHRCGEWAMQRNDHIGSMAIVRRDSFANDQWSLAGGTSVRVHYPAAGRFDGDDSQLVAGDCDGPSLEQALAELPADAFDALWLVDTAPRPVPAGWTRIHEGDSQTLYLRTGQAGRRTTQP